MIDSVTSAQGDSILGVAARYLDSTGAVPSTMDRRPDVARALGVVTDYYARGLFPDSIRFDRIIDHVAVTMEMVRGELVPLESGTPEYPRYRPKRTPYLTWVYYKDTGVFFQPVVSVESYLIFFPSRFTPSDTLRLLGEALNRYAVWRTDGGRRFPVWEYNFAFNSGGVVSANPWQSSMAQGLALLVYTQMYERTSAAVWRGRADEVVNSYKVTWDRGGVLLADTTNGYWWEEFDPKVRIWNGSVLALLSLDYYATVTGDPEARRMVDRGLEAVRATLPLYDNGSWTAYSLKDPQNTVSYHNFQIMLADTLAHHTRDPFFRDMARRWKKYEPPPEVAAPTRPGHYWRD